jgi:hypothetical protein
MSNIKDQVADAGQTAAEAAKSAGHKIVDGAKKAVEFVKEKTGISSEGKDVGVAGIQERMDVIASCGKKVGVVDHVEGGAIKLTRKDSSDGQHHFIPKTWVDHVDNHVHLKKNSVETEQGWKSDAISCASCGA